MGFFVASSQRNKRATEKVVTFTRIVNGEKQEFPALILPSAKHGLPNVADLEKYLALMQVALAQKDREGGTLTNPVAFTSAQILRLLGKHRDSGKNYAEVNEWLDVLSSTTFIVQAAAYDKEGKKRREGRARFHIFDTVVSYGDFLESGKVADRHYVFFSKWQQDNINSGYLLTVDLQSFLQLRNYIAKSLVLPLQVWLYASRDRGYFEKRYDHLCHHLDLTQYHYLSQIKQKLGPSLDELRDHGYISRWEIRKTRDGQGFKILFWHPESKQALPGASKTEDRQSPQAEQPVETEAETAIKLPPIVARLMKWGISREEAEDLVSDKEPDQQIEDQLEYAEQEIQRQGKKIQNPAGFIIALIRKNRSLPTTFVSSRQKELLDQHREAQERADQELEAAYKAQEKARAFIAAQNLQEEFAKRLQEKVAFRRRVTGEKFSDEQLTRWAEEDLLQDYAEHLSDLPSKDEFAAEFRKRTRSETST